MAEISIYKPCT